MRRTPFRKIAAYAIRTYTAPDDLVIDPMSGTGDVLVESVLAGRMAIGIEHQRYWVDRALERIAGATDAGAPGFATALHGSGQDPAALIGHESRGKVALILTAPQNGTTSLPEDQTPASNIEDLAAGVASSVKSLLPLLRPSGRVAIACWPVRHEGVRVDMPSLLADALMNYGTTAADHIGIDNTCGTLLLFPAHDLRESMPGMVDLPGIHS